MTESPTNEPRDPPPPYHITIHDSQGIVIGEHNQVVQQYGAPRGSDDPAAYTAYLQRQYQRMPFGGIAPRIQDRPLALPLVELFVPLQAEPDAPLQGHFVMSGMSALPAARSATGQRQELADLLTHPHLLLLGEPGSGKSTLLRWLIAEQLKVAPTSDGSSQIDALPLLVRLAQVGRVLQHQGPSLTLSQYLTHHHLPDFQPLIERWLAGGRGWLLLDGLDEVADGHLRRQIRDMVEAFAARFGEFHIVVTSRVVGYRQAPLHGDFRPFTLLPFGQGEVEQFVQQWYRAVARASRTLSLEEADARAARLLDGLQEKPRLRQMAGTPLLLAMIALMDWKGRELPKRRVELYRVAIETLLEDWPVAQGRALTDGLGLAETLQILIHLAATIFESGNPTAIRQEELVGLILPLITQVREGSLAQVQEVAQRWLLSLSEQRGLLQEAGVDDYLQPVYSFLHLSFVEYLTGRARCSSCSAGAPGSPHRAATSRRRS